MGTLDFGPFLSLSTAVRARLVAASAPARFSPGETIVREGDPPGDVIALASGRVRVMTGDRLRTLATMAAPALVGEMAVVLDQPRNATVVASASSVGLRIPKDALLGAIAGERDFAQELRAFADLRAATNFLRRDSPFADLPSEAIADLAAHLVPASFMPGDVILQQGERGDEAFLLRSGEVEVVHVQDGVERVVGHGAAGAFLGEVSVLTGAPRSATARATTHVRAFRISGEDVRTIVKKYRQVVARLESTMQVKHSPQRNAAVRVLPAPDDPRSLILHDPKGGTYLRLSTEGLAIYEDLDGDRSLRELAMRHAERTGLDDPATVFATVAALQAAGLVTTPRIASDEPDARLMRLLDLVLAPRLELKDADRIAGLLHRLLRPAFTRPGAIAAIAIGATGAVALARTFRQATAADFGIGGLAVAFIGLALAGLGHEAAHAIATKAEGRRVGRAGLGLLWFTPVIWVDTSDAWFIGRTRRAIVNAAGPLFNFALAGVLGIGAALSTGQVQDLAVWLAIANLVSVVFNLSPLLEFDGYYVLSDLANVNALRRKALRFVFADLIRHPRRLRTRLEAGFVAYTAAAVAYILGITVLVLSGVPGLVAGIIPPGVADELKLLAGAGVALAMAALLVGPFVGEVSAAVKSADATGTHAERLEERISKTDLSAAVSAKTSSPMLHAPSETRR
ncbi:MAG TPA: cyclic nucleotide-binding domain-containing protein [Candidatus Limnocylindria bacterium]|nr:cyclic nucleotide-binding domain-containing protein [Candidatus Limnocylindria bacterium]